MHNLDNKMNNYTKHALNEFKILGWMNEDGSFEDPMQAQICNHLMDLLYVFANEGHSGTSAPYTIKLFEHLANFKPIGPLTGEDSEWEDVSSYNGDNVLYQNTRASHVFKDRAGAYDVNGKVFWSWVSDPDIDDGEPFQSSYISADSKVPVTFPYVVHDHPEYVFEPTEAFPNEHLK